MSRLYPNTLRTLFVAVLVAAALLAGARATYAQDAAEPEASPTPSASPESEELRRLRERNALLEEQKKIAVNEKDIEAAKKAKLETQFPKPTTTPLAGTTEVDSGVKIESQMAAYASMAGAANKIAKELKTKGVSITHLAVYNNRDIKALLGYTVIDNQIDLMKQRYCAQFATAHAPCPAAAAPPPTAPIKRGAAAFSVTAPLTIASSVLGSFIDLIALFRTDTTVNGMSFDIAESALVSEVFRALKRDDPNGYGSGISLYYPAVFPPNLNADQSYFILGKIQDLYMLKDRSDKLAARIDETEKKLGETVAEIATLKKTVKQANDDLPALDKELERLEKVYFKWPSPRLAERIEELHGRIEKLKDDRGKAAAALPSKNALKVSLEDKLEELYSELSPKAGDIITPNVVKAAIKRAELNLESAERVLGRKFREAEVIALARGFSDAEKKQLIEEAEKSKGAKLSEAEKSLLTEPPLSDIETTALGQIARAQAAAGHVLTDDEKAAALTNAQKFAIAPDEDQATLRTLREQAVAALKVLNTQFDKLVAELVKVDEAVGVNALTSYIQAENLRVALGCADGSCAGGAPADSFWIQLRVVSAGGNNKVKRNLITNIFTGDNISHSGGSIVEYILYDMNGNAKYSSTHTAYQDYIKAKDIKKLADGNHNQ